jgi:hypothetical protein
MWAVFRTDNGILARYTQDSPAAEDALATICEMYWYPLYAYIHRQGGGREEAEEFVAILSRGLTGARPGATRRGSGGGSYESAAAALGMEAGAARVAVHRLRKRYRALLREEISRTLADPAAVDDELASLFAAFRR